MVHYALVTANSAAEGTTGCMLYDDIDVVQLRWLGHVVRLDTSTPPLKVVDEKENLYYVQRIR